MRQRRRGIHVGDGLADGDPLHARNRQNVPGRPIVSSTRWAFERIQLGDLGLLEGSIQLGDRNLLPDWRSIEHPADDPAQVVAVIRFATSNCKTFLDRLWAAMWSESHRKAAASTGLAFGEHLFRIQFRDPQLGVGVDGKSNWSSASDR
jgi:hypothetical protein